MEWQHKAANNFNGFPMRLQTLGVARAGHSTSTLNWLHSSLSSPTPPPRFLLCSFVAAAACECLSQSGREKKDEAEATPMPCECCGTVWMRMNVSECDCECACEREWFLDNRKCIVSRAISFGYLLCQVWRSVARRSARNSISLMQK